MFRIAADSFTLLRHMAVIVACSLSYYNTNSYPVIICLFIVFNSTWAATLATLCVCSSFLPSCMTPGPGQE